jgi:hypothetical protein
VEAYTWSPDGSMLLVYTNSARVWRANTRGDYWLLQVAGGSLRKLGGDGPPSTMMFAKFSPDNRMVGYVREHNIFVEDLATGAITQLTRDGSRDIINGTFDWVYEEEFFLRDGFRWSPDSRLIAYWQLDASGVRDYLLLNTTDSLYSFTVPIEYPKAGTQNSAARVGVVPVDAAGGRPPEQLHRPHGMVGQLRRDRPPVPEPAAEHPSAHAGLGRHRRGADGADRAGQRLGQRSGRSEMAGHRPAVYLGE